jgi:nucleotide-binding universal stress UspA family protein
MPAAVVMVAERACPSPQALAFALRESRLREATLHVVCVIPLDIETGQVPVSLREAFGTLERALRPRAAEAGVEVRMHVTGMRNAGLLAGSVRRLQAQVLIMSHAPCSRFWGLSPESLAKKMLDLSPCPVLVTA